MSSVAIFSILDFQINLLNSKMNLNNLTKYQKTPSNRPLSDFAITIDELEKLTDLDLFTNLPDELETWDLRLICQLRALMCMLLLKDSFSSFSCNFLCNKKTKVS